MATCCSSRRRRGSRHFQQAIYLRSLRLVELVAKQIAGSVDAIRIIRVPDVWRKHESAVSVSSV
jgi:hypothetical protein